VLSKIEHQVAPDGNLPQPKVAVARVQTESSLKALFRPDMIMRTFLGSLILIALNTAVYGFIAFLPTFMVRQGLSIVTTLNYATVMMFGGPVGALIGMWLSDKIGRKPIITWFSLLAILFGSLYPNMTDPIFVTLFGFLLVTAVYVLVATAWALYVAELFPTTIRMRGAGFCNTMGRMMTIITPQLIVPIYVAAGVTGVIGLVSALMLLMVVMVGFFGIETREKSLEALVPSKVTV